MRNSYSKEIYLQSYKTFEDFVKKKKNINFCIITMKIGILIIHILQILIMYYQFHYLIQITF